MTTARRNMIVAGLMCGMLLASLDQTIAATAMPTIIAELGGMSRMTWVTTAYMLASTSIVPIVGKLADIYGRRRWYLIGMMFFIGGSALCGLASTMTQLIVFRAIQGIGGGMLMPVAQTIVGDLFPGAARAKVQGVVGAVFGMASIFGPKLGGWIVDAWNWRWIFYINLPLGVAAAVILWFTLQESLGSEGRKVDYIGSLCVATATSLMLLGLVNGGTTYPWGSWQTISLLGGSAAAWIAFLVVEYRAVEPILPLDLFQNRVFAVSSGVVFLTGLGMFGVLTFIPLFMQGVVGVSASTAGSVLTPLMLAMVAGSILGGRLIVRIGYRVQLASGMSLVALAFYFMSQMGVSTTQAMATSLMVLAGFGVGLVMPTITIAVQNAFPADRRGTVTSATVFFRAIGGTLGVTILGVVMNNRAASVIVENVTPLLTKLPAAAAGPVQAMAAREPQALFALLLRPETLQQLPEAMRAPVVAMLRESLAQTLQTVFLVGFGLVVVGALVSLLIGNARLEEVRR